MAQPVYPPPTSGKAKDLDAQTMTSWFQSIRAPGSTVPPPPTSGTVGIAGQIAYDQNFLYVCVAKNLWKRIALVAF